MLFFFVHSTVSAYLNSISGLLYKDYICSMRHYKHTEQKANLIMRLLICLIGAYCVIMGILVAKSSSLFQVNATISSLSTGAVTGIFTLGLFYPWASQKVSRTGWDGCSEHIYYTSQLEQATLVGTITSMVLMTFLIVGSQMHKNVYTTLPTSTEGCAARNITVPPNSGL